MRESKFEDKLYRLYTLANWTRPWSAVSSLHLDPHTDVPRGIFLAAEIYNIPQLASIPAEIANSIRDYSRLDIIWRFASVLDRIERLSNADPQLDSLPLREVSMWERGGRPTVLADPCGGVIRLTIDSQGLKKIERLRIRPKHQPCPSDALAYVVESEKRFRKITVGFKACLILFHTLRFFTNAGQFGLAHLNTPPGPTHLNVWDRPCPPNLRDCYGFRKSSRLPFTRVTAIEPQKCTGITFFLDNALLDMHAHTTKQSSTSQDTKFVKLKTFIRPSLFINPPTHP